MEKPEHQNAEAQKSHPRSDLNTPRPLQIPERHVSDKHNKTEFNIRRNGSEKLDWTEPPEGNRPARNSNQTAVAFLT